MRSVAEGSFVGAIVIAAIGLILNIGAPSGATDGENEKYAQAPPLIEPYRAPDEPVDEQGRCLDPSWGEDDSARCRQSWSETQCLILEGAHLDAQNQARYYLENLYLPTDYYCGVKQDKKLTKWGDIPPDIGVCTDTVIRALRHAGIDLQWLVFRDMKKEQDLPKAKQKYPWGSFGKKTADSNIDHRRCPNLQRFFELHGEVLTVETDEAHLHTWQPGDIVYWNLGKRKHIGVVSDTVGASGLPRVFHNFPDPGFACEEDALTSFEILGHYRYPAPGQDIPHVPKPAGLD
jgi:hypothetical protein